MATELNKNKKWPSKQEVTKRTKKINDSDIKNSLKSIINLMTAAIKAKHL
jgi:hypothetical protein